MIKKLAMFSDIHFGKKNNSKIHNQDCLDFIDWFCDNVEKEGDITHIGFLGDWFESRSSINIQTLEMSYQGLKKLNSLDIPILFIVGNHDLHRRSTREIHSVNMFQEMSNIQVIDKITMIDDTAWIPFLFHSEYKDPEVVKAFNDATDVFGHLEFRGFMMTGYNFVLDKGPDHSQFSGPRNIFCGHFHKRQANDNVIYIGNTFPMDFGDTGDSQRGMCIFDREKNKICFEDWEDCPMYFKTKLSDITKTGVPKWKKMRVQCVGDLELSFTEVQELKDALVTQYDLRELDIQDARTNVAALEGEEEEIDENEDLKSVDETVVECLMSIEDVTSVQPDTLVNIYKELKVEN